MLTRYRLVFSLAAVLIAMTVSASADSLAYVVTNNLITNVNNFGTANLGDGSFNTIGPSLPEPTGGLVSGPGGSLLTLGFSGELYSINPGTGAVTAIGNTGIGSTSPPPGFPSNASFTLSLGEVNGSVYATDLNNNLYSINTSTGAASFIGATGMPGDPGAGTMNPDGSINLCDEALFTVEGNLYATYDKFTIGSDGYTTTIENAPELWQINTATGAATPQWTSLADLHILGVTDIGGVLYAFQGFPSPANPSPLPLVEVETLDLSSGATSPVSELDPGAALIGGVVPDVPEPASLALVSTGLIALASRLKRSHSKDPL